MFVPGDSASDEFRRHLNLHETPEAEASVHYRVPITSPSNRYAFDDSDLT